MAWSDLTRREKVLAPVGCVIIIGYLLYYGGLIVVAIHFIRKLW